MKRTVSLTMPRWFFIAAIVGILVGIVMVTNIVYNPKLSAVDRSDLFLLGVMFWAPLVVLSMLFDSIGWDIGWKPVKNPKPMPVYPELNQRQYWNRVADDAATRWRTGRHNQADSAA